MDANTSRRAAALTVALLGLFPAGCSLVTMTGKMLFGDPVIVPEFTRVTHVDLVRQKKTVAVVCTAAAAVENEYPGINSNILRNVTQALKREDVRVINSSKVTDFLEEHHNMWDGPDELAEAIDADYIIHIEVEELTHKVDRSPGLFQGRSQGTVHAYEVAREEGRKRAREVLSSRFESKYPANAPRSANKMSGEHFQREYVQRISAQIARKFYRHHASETVD